MGYRCVGLVCCKRDTEVCEAYTARTVEALVTADDVTLPITTRFLCHGIARAYTPLSVEMVIMVLSSMLTSIVTQDTLAKMSTRVSLYDHRLRMLQQANQTAQC